MTEVWNEQFARAQESEETLGLDEDLNVEDYPSEALVSLLHLGKLSKEVVIRGHTVRLRTLTMGEELEIGPLIKRYTGTPEEGRAYACALVASSVVSVDDMPIVQKLGESSGTLEQQQKFDYIRSKWYWPVIEEVYAEFIKLHQEQIDAVKELQSKYIAGLR